MKTDNYKFIIPIAQMHICNYVQNKEGRQIGLQACRNAQDIRKDESGQTDRKPYMKTDMQPVSPCKKNLTSGEKLA